MQTPPTTSNAEKYGSVTVLERLGKKCVGVCDCGTRRLFNYYKLRSGRARSCGCRQSEGAIKHGLSAHPLYGVWNAMVQRCKNPNSLVYARYGGRGITVCEKWLTFEGFYEDVIGLWKPELTMDRRDNDGNYELTNIRFTDRGVQANNRSSNRIIEHNGLRKTLSEWAIFSGVNYKVLWARVNAKWDFARCLIR